MDAGLAMAGKLPWGGRIFGRRGQYESRTRSQSGGRGELGTNPDQRDLATGRHPGRTPAQRVEEPGPEAPPPSWTSSGSRPVRPRIGLSAVRGDEVGCGEAQTSRSIYRSPPRLAPA